MQKPPIHSRRHRVVLVDQSAKDVRPLDPVRQPDRKLHRTVGDLWGAQTQIRLPTCAWVIALGRAAWSLHRLPGQPPIARAANLTEPHMVIESVQCDAPSVPLLPRR
jgi:hypothetical protein